MSNRIADKSDVCVVALTKGDQTYTVFHADTPDGRKGALLALGKWASNPELTFSWYDAAVLSQKVRKGS